MKHDNQWRPSESRSRRYTPYQRHKLKDTNWITPEEAAAISKRYNHWRYHGNWHKEPNWRLEIEFSLDATMKDGTPIISYWQPLPKKP